MIEIHYVIHKYLHKARGIALPLRVNELFSAILSKYPLLNKSLKIHSTCKVDVGEDKSYLRRRTVNFSITWGHPLLIFQLGIQVAHLTRVDYLLSSLGASYG